MSDQEFLHADQDRVDYNDFIWLMFLLPPVLLAAFLLSVFKWVAEKFRGC